MSMQCKKQKRTILSILFIFIYLFPTTLYSSGQDLKKMNTPLYEKISDLLPSDNSFYYSFNDEADRAMSWKLTITNNTEGMILGAPDRVDISSINNKIPLLWLQRLLAIRDWQVEEKRNSFLIITNLPKDVIVIKYAWAGRPKRFDFSSIPLSAHGNPPPASEGIMPSIEMLDIREILYNQLEPAKYAFTMTQYDWVSNTIQVAMIDSTGKAPEIPKISESVSRQISSGYEAAALNMKDSSVFSPSLNPPLVSHNGIAAVVPKKVAKKDYQWMMHGSIRTPVAPGAIVNLSETHKDFSTTPAAIVTAMVIINKLDNKEPSWITLKLPVRSSCKAGQLADVSFSVNLKRFNDQFAEAGVYQVFVACGAFVAGPFALEVTP
jgi:hypothetical protein